MTSADLNAQDVQAIRKDLARFSRLQVPPVLSEAESAKVRQALDQLNQASDYQTLGICADTLAAAKAAMESYLRALGVEVTLSLPEKSEAVYLKFNTLKGLWYLDDYGGSSRGVLITYHASELDEVNGTYGPLPLTLFTES
ncbi:MAG: DUF1824 family protein [Leptolyngbyaceae cyanobacterium SM1_1_3]|nr:DUF1824 family protein [Leptolyngbyaceae cyanobacterium SM1_1_3]NJN02540.1 DUF1824 family protein [Leptolyngbyaceae cyanobacterium RM1_1_2]NJO08560.1 DUF1824 family protein [Leptolyngbyaceae cyanobacterium SL_1_1]